MDRQQDLADQVAWLRQTVQWMIPIGIGSTLIYGAGAALFAQPLLALMAGTTLLVSIASVWVRWSIGHRSIPTLVLALVLALWTTIVVVSITIPVTLPGTVAALVMTIALALPYVPSAMLRWLSLAGWLLSLITVVLARYLTIFAPLPQQVADMLYFFVTLAVVAVCLLLLWQFHARLTTSLHHAQTANSALVQAQAGLEAQVAERTATLRNALDDVEARAADQTRMREELEQQREAIRELSVPVIPVLVGVLVMPLVGALDSARASVVAEQVLRAVEQRGARMVIFDVTGLPIIDTQVAQVLLHTTAAVRLLGAQVVIVGIRPEVAQTMVALQLDLGAIATYPDLQEAVAATLRAAGWQQPERVRA